MTVATAAPATPIGFTSRISNTMFNREENTRKISGVILSPRERRIPDVILYKKVAGMPMNTIKM